MWRLDEGGDVGGLKITGRLDASEGEEDFLLRVVSAECTVSLPPPFPLLSATQTRVNALQGLANP